MSDKNEGQPAAARTARLGLRDLLNPLAIVIAGAMISGAILWRDGQQPQVVVVPQPAASVPAQPVQPAPPPADIALVNLQGEPMIGDANAPVVMAYWFDYQCPFCRQEEENVLTQLVAEYVDTGKIRVVFKDYQFLGPDSQTAGLAARAVWEVAPEKFREWHKAMFDHQDDENAGWGNKDDIIALTKTIQGIDAAKVEELMTSKEAIYSGAMAADATEGNSMGVGGTPSFLIGKQMVVGAYPYPPLKAVIEQYLNAR
jgi:protein-disulfide isomerase